MTNPSSPRPPGRARPPTSTPPARLADYPSTPAGVIPAARAPGSGRVSSRRRFWFGFFTSFLLLSVASCGGLVLSTGLNRFDLASLQGGEAAWSPPLVTPTTTPDPALAGTTTDQGGAGVFTIGQQVQNITNSRVNLRQTPGHLGKPDNDILVQIQPGDRMTIVGGPATADNLVWWLMEYTAADGRAIEGWAAEATASGVQILGH